VGKGRRSSVVKQALLQKLPGLIKVARHLLDLWADVADKKIAQPCWCCSDRQTECYPHDALLRFQTHNVSWPLAQETVRKSPRQRGQLPGREVFNVIRCAVTTECQWRMLSHDLPDWTIAYQ